MNQRLNILDLVFTNEENMVTDVKHCSPLGKHHHQTLLFRSICYSEDESQQEALYNFPRETMQSWQAWWVMKTGRNWAVWMHLTHGNISLIKSKLQWRIQYLWSHKTQDPKNENLCGWMKLLKKNICKLQKYRWKNCSEGYELNQEHCSMNVMCKVLKLQKYKKNVNMEPMRTQSPE